MAQYNVYAGTAFKGQLTPNKIVAGLYNAIIAHYTEANNIKSMASKLVNMFKMDGSVYGDKYLYTSLDINKTGEFTGTDYNVLEPEPFDAPYTQAITIDTFRQTAVTISDYLTRAAWENEYSFSNFIGVLLTFLEDTKRVYECSLVNTYIGSTSTSLGKQTQIITFEADSSGVEAEHRLNAQTIAKAVADVVVDLTNPSRDYNDIGFMRSYNPEDLVCIFPASKKNAITYLDEPTIFHKDGLFDNLENVVLPDNYFLKTTSDPVPFNTLDSTTTIYALKEMDCTYNYKGGAGGADTYTRVVHYFPGNHIAKEVTIIDNKGVPRLAGLVSYQLDGDVVTTTEFAAGDFGVIDDTILVKILSKDSIKFMSGFSVGTSFWNPKSLSTNHYLTWSHSSLNYLKDKPFITLKKAAQ